jgi:hypothetical protein
MTPPPTVLVRPGIGPRSAGGYRARHRGDVAGPDTAYVPSPTVVTDLTCLDQAYDNQPMSGGTPTPVTGTVGTTTSRRRGSPCCGRRDHGHVQQRRGTQHGPAGVSVMVSTPANGSYYGFAKTAADGSYTVQGMPAGTDYQHAGSWTLWDGWTPLPGTSSRCCSTKEESNVSRLSAESNRMCHLWVMSSFRRSPATADWLGVEAHLTPGAVAAAMRADRGPVLHGAGLGVWLRGVSRRRCVRPCSTAARPARPRVRHHRIRPGTVAAPLIRHAT